MTDDKRRKTRRTARCPVCNAPARRETRPFCSRRCADADLGRWLTGAYRVPTDERPGDGPGAEPDGDGSYSDNNT